CAPSGGCAGASGVGGSGAGVGGGDFSPGFSAGSLNGGGCGGGVPVPLCARAPVTTTTPCSAIRAIRPRPVLRWLRGLRVRCPEALRPRARPFQNRPAMYSTDTATSDKPQLFSSPRRSCVHACVRVLLIAAVVAAAAGCGRTALEPPYDPSTADAGRDRPTDLPAEKMDAPPDLPPDLPKDHPPDLRPETISCVPTDEECN